MADASSDAKRTVTFPFAEGLIIPFISATFPVVPAEFKVAVPTS